METFSSSCIGAPSALDAEELMMTVPGKDGCEKLAADLPYNNPKGFIPDESEGTEQIIQERGAEH